MSKTKDIGGITVAVPPQRVEPHVDVAMDVRNQSSRLGVLPSLIVLHATQGKNIPGTADLSGVGVWFNNPQSQASAHVGVDGEGNSARYVPDSAKAWSCAFYNKPSLNIEQIGFSSQHADWPDVQLQEVARWIARWSDLHNIPIQAADVTDSGLIIAKGVIRHEDLGSLGGAHHDPDEDTHTYPLHTVLELARFYASFR